VKIAVYFELSRDEADTGSTYVTYLIILPMLRYSFIRSHSSSAEFIAFITFIKF